MAPTATESFPGVMPPPPGEKVDLSGSESIAWQLILMCVLCPVVSAALVLVRLCTARRIVQKIFLDDCE